MNRRSFLQSLATGALFSATLLALPAEAQRHDRNGRIDRNDRQRVMALIRRLNAETDTLRNRVNELARRDRIAGTRARRLQDRVRELDAAISRLNVGVGRARVFNRNVSRREMNELLRAGNRVQEVIQGERNWRDRLGRPWDQVRRHLNDLAEIYGLRTLGERR